MRGRQAMPSRNLRVRDLGGHPRQAGDAQQEFARAGLETLEYFSCQVVEHGLGRRVARHLRDPAREFGVLQHQHQARRPALRALGELRERLAFQLVPAQVRDLSELRRLQAQLGAAHAHHFPRHPKARERSGRLVAAGDDDAAVLGHVRKAGLERGVQGTLGGYLVKVVEHQCEGRTRAREKLAEEAARERREVGVLQGSGPGQLQGRRAVELACGVAEVVEEGGDVRVVGVHLVPEAAVAARLDVTRRERGLAGARRPRDPGHGAPGGSVQAREQPLARHRGSDGRAGGLGERDALRFQVGQVCSTP